MMFPKGKKGRPKPALVDGIEFRLDKSTNEFREICRTAKARERRRREIYERAEGKCEGDNCGRPLRFEAGYPDSMHWHHEKHKGMGGGFTDDSLGNGRCLCESCHLIKEHGQF